MKTTLTEKTIRAVVFTSACFLAYFFGKKILKYRDARPSKKDKRDYRIAPSGVTAYPEVFSIPTPPPENQEAVSSCVAHSCSYLCESVMNKRDNLPDRHFATGFVYGYRPSGYFQGEGMYPREALKTLQEVGNVPKQVFPQNVEVPVAIQLVNQRIGELKRIAVNHRIQTYFKLEKENEIKDCLLKHGPVTAMFPVYECLENPVNGKVEFDGGKGFRGYHQMTIYGWNGRYWKILNSWGGDFGNDGDQDGAVLMSMQYPIMEKWGVSTDPEAAVKPVKKPWTTIFCPWRW